MWHPEGLRLTPVRRVNRVAMTLLKGMENQRDTLLANTERFAQGLPANNALLWGARGMGKSSLVKAVHEQINATRKGAANKDQSTGADRDPPRGHRHPAAALAHPAQRASGI